MLVLPVPMFAAIVLAWALARAVLRGEVHPLIRLVIALCALQAVFVSLRQYYGVPWVWLIQPITATAIPVLCYVAFRALAVRPLERMEALLHALVPAFALFCMLFAPATLDAVVAGVFLAYGAAILFQLRRGPDALALVRLEAGGMPARGWRLLAVFLVASALSDGLVAMDMVRTGGRLTPLILSLFSSLTLLGLGLLSLSRTDDTGGHEVAGDVAEQAAVEAGDVEVVTRLKALMEDRRVYRNPDLTLRQMARMLTLPVKSVSAAVNRVERKNVSQFVNEYRVRDACRLLTESSETVTGAMLAAGFQTKSNFNREFRRVTGSSPTEWLARRETA